MEKSKLSKSYFDFCLLAYCLALAPPEAIVTSVRPISVSVRKFDKIAVSVKFGVSVIRFRKTETNTKLFEVSCFFQKLVTLETFARKRGNDIIFERKFAK